MDSWVLAALSDASSTLRLGSEHKVALGTNMSVDQVEYVQTAGTATQHVERRMDVQGLRALAVLLVVALHAGAVQFSGGYVGVDVFFVISGYVIVNMFLRQTQEGKHVKLASFWAGRVRRLIPAASLALIVTAVASARLLSPIDAPRVGVDIMFASFWSANIHYALGATDYLGGSANPSPVLHYWSLGVEEQFYLLIPLLVSIVLLWAGRHQGRRQAGLTALFSLLAFVSFGACITLVSVAQPWAFFSPLSRTWEFSAGALIAILGSRLTHQRLDPLRTPGVLSGLGMIVASSMLLTAHTTWPSYLTLVPVVGASLILAAGTANNAGSVLLSSPLLVWLGDRSYSWYLWHWPVLVLGATLLDHPSLETRLLLALASLGVAAACYQWVENPLRHMKKSTPAIYAAGLAAVLLSAGAGYALSVHHQSRNITVNGEHVQNTATNQLVPAGFTWPAGPLTPDPSVARGDNPSIYADGCHADFNTTTAHGCARGKVGASTHIVLLGDSHAAQWFPTLDSAGKKHGFELDSYTKSGCPAPTVTIIQPDLGRAYGECDKWRADALNKIVAAKPSLAIISSLYPAAITKDGTNPLSGADAWGAWKDGWKETLAMLDAANIPVLVIHDTPYMGEDEAACAAAHLDNLQACAVARVKAAADTAHDIDIVADVSKAKTLDMTDVLCDQVCPVAHGKYLVWRDNQHLTATFATALDDIMYYALQRLKMVS